MHENYLSVLTSGHLGWSSLGWGTKPLPVSPLRPSLSPLPAQEHVKCLSVQCKDPSAFLFSSHWILKNRTDDYCTKLACIWVMSFWNFFKIPNLPTSVWPATISQFGNLFFKSRRSSRVTGRNQVVSPFLKRTEWLWYSEFNYEGISKGWLGSLIMNIHICK